MYQWHHSKISPKLSLQVYLHLNFQQFPGGACPHPLESEMAYFAPLLTGLSPGISSQVIWCTVWFPGLNAQLHS